MNLILDRGSYVSVIYLPFFLNYKKFERKIEINLINPHFNDLVLFKLIWIHNFLRIKSNNNKSVLEKALVL